MKTGFLGDFYGETRVARENESVSEVSKTVLENHAKPTQMQFDESRYSMHASFRSWFVIGPLPQPPYVLSSYEECNSLDRGHMANRFLKEACMEYRDSSNCI